ncbi:MAG: 1-acyl-sn-glycerol-3-phosphate acyltransferase [Clostridia bacterium]|nr:1-acyl-sn-glycerol-3-phosphate acyltransferase [Clostridia bacterium]
MEKNKNRLTVIENIKKYVEQGKFNSKVEVGDHIVTEEERNTIVMGFDTLRENKKNIAKRATARKLANKFTKIFNKNTQIIGMENVQSLEGGAIITANHFHPTDSTAIRHLTNELDRTSKLDIVIEEENLFMKEFSLLMNYCNTIPLSKSDTYMKKKFFPAIKKFLNKNHWILIFPEEEMWYNYKKPRPGKIGAYHLAVKYNVPIIPTFTAMYERPKEFDDDGFNKVDFKLYVMEPLYPDMNLPLKQRKQELMKKDYELKVKAYEKAYGKKLDYKFEDWDIAGLEEKD